MSNHIIFEQRKNLGLITLNRPQALNAANADMARAMLDQLAVWADDAGVERVAIQGVGKAFCAGGDIRAVYDMGADAMWFFKPEYDLCRAIRAYPKPYIALMDGITMGGGVGLSIYGAHRIATPNTLWAMPECAIGFYPDIGATYFLPRLPGEVGTYLALTGARLGAGDLLALGIATGFVEDGEKFLSHLENSPLPRGEAAELMPIGISEAGEGISNRLDRSPLTSFSKPCRLRETCLSPRERQVINRCFAFSAVEEIIAALETESGEWAEQTLAALQRASPTSLKVTLRQMRIGKTLTFDQAIDLEYRLTANFLKRPDFREGIRAALIDRDRQPKWRPDRLEDVSDKMVEDFFL